jgi:predicted ATP-dependent endonuclease of OLD family
VNYRSIKNLRINFDKHLKIFIGLNESGKSNILKSLSLLSKGSSVNKDDLRDSYGDTELSNENYVRFVVEFNNSEMNKLYNEDIKKVFTSNDKNANTLKQIYLENNQLLYQINLKSGEWQKMHWWIGENYEIAGNIIKINKTITPRNITHDEKIISIQNYDYMIYDDSYQVPNNLIESKKDIKIFYDILRDSRAELFNKLYPQVVYWPFGVQKDIPSKINTTAFINNVGTCIPLQNMFRLAGIENISNAIQESRQRKNGFANLLKRVSKMSTDYLHSVWQDAKNINFELQENGDSIAFSIQDEENLYEFSRRSDGFKRFVALLLEIGAQNKSGSISNIIFLIDEPDTGLHPSGSRYLLKELLSISKNNYVYYATHSIFLINKDDIASHYIVTKDDEITTVKQAERTNIIDEEILYNALGYSAFEVLKAYNVIFEGWRDKKLFEKAIKSLKNDSEYKDIIDKIGFCHSQGVKDAQRVVSLLELANRNYIYVSDTDKPAQEAKDRFRDKENWITYGSITNAIVTCEDYLATEYSNKILEKICMNHGYSINLSGIVENNILEQYTKLLAKLPLKKDAIKSLVNEYKEILFTEVDDKDIKQCYIEFVKTVIDKLIKKE